MGGARGDPTDPPLETQQKTTTPLPPILLDQDNVDVTEDVECA